MPTIAVMNRSTMVKNADVEVMCQAIQHSLDIHVAPAWQVQSGTVKFYANEAEVPGWAWHFYIIDNDTSVPGALGYHTLDNSGRVQAFIMCAPILNNGGVVLFDPTGKTTYSVSGCLSHEVNEAWLDRFCVDYAVNGNNMYALEICDPCEDGNIVVDVNGQSVWVSNFIYPAWFNAENTTGPFDYLKALKAPFSLTAGGYFVVGTSPANLTQQFGSAMPEWRRTMKRSAVSRGARRVGQKLGLWSRLVKWLLG
jgi:hypothetical protein